MSKDKEQQEEALAYVYRFRGAIWIEIKRILEDPYLAEDAFQETIFRFLRYYRRVDTSLDFVVRKYLLTIAKNAALSIYNKHKKIRLSREEESLDIEAQGPSVEDIVINKETVQEVIEKIRSMDEKYAMPLILFVVEDKSYKDVRDFCRGSEAARLLRAGKTETADRFARKRGEEMKRSRKSEDAILDAFLLRAMEAENQALKETPEETLDEETDERLKVLIQTAYRKACVRRRWKRRTLKAFACIAITLTLSLTVVLNVDAWRTKLLNYTIAIFEDHGVIYSESMDFDDDHPRYLPTKIPNGFELTETLMDTENTLMLEYENEEEGSSFIVYLSYVPTNIKFDTENATIKKKMIGTEEVIITTRNNFIQILGKIEGTDYQFIISGDLAVEELLNVASSFQPVTK